MKVIKSKKLYDGISENNGCYIGFEGDKITYIDSEKPLQNDVEIIAEDAVVTPAFIDLHSHIGMVRAGEPAGKDDSNDHMHPISPLINALHSIYMDGLSFAESVENGVLCSVVLPGSGNVVGGKAVFPRNFEENIEKAYENGWDLDDLSSLIDEWETICPHAGHIEKMFATWQPMISKVEQKLSEDELEAFQEHLCNLVIKQEEFQAKIKALEHKLGAYEAKTNQENN